MITQDNSLEADEDNITNNNDKVSLHLGCKHLGMSFPKQASSDSSNSEEDKEITLYQCSALVNCSLCDYENEEPSTFAAITQIFHFVIFVNTMLILNVLNH